MVEDIDEYMYRLDRALWQVLSAPGMDRIAGLRLGRCGEIPENDPDYVLTEVEMAQGALRRRRRSRISAAPISATTRRTRSCRWAGDGGKSAAPAPAAFLSGHFPNLSRRIIAALRPGWQ